MREVLKGVTKGDVRRLARRAGVQRMAGTMYEEARLAMAGFLRVVLHDAAVFAEFARRKTIIPSDLLLSLRRQGRIFYGVH